MSRVLVAVVVTALLLSGRRTVVAQTVTVSGNPGLLRINSAIAGSNPTSVTNSSTTYTVITPTPNRTYAITAQLDAPMPAGVTLTATLAAPAGATSLGPVALDMTARNCVTGIAKNLVSTQSITYQLSATAAAGVISSSTRTVTLTIVRFP